MESHDVIWGETRDGGFREVLIVPNKDALDTVQERMDTIPEAWGWTMDLSSDVAREVALQVINFATEARHRAQAWHDYSNPAGMPSALSLAYAPAALAGIREANRVASDPRVASPEAIAVRREAMLSAHECGGGVLRLLLGKNSGHRGLRTYAEWTSLWNEDPSVLRRLTYGV